jgi:hypothetical protein
MSSRRSTKYGKESRSHYEEQEEDEQQTIEFFCNNCSCKLALVEGQDQVIIAVLHGLSQRITLEQ